MLRSFLSIFTFLVLASSVSFSAQAETIFDRLKNAAKEGMKENSEVDRSADASYIEKAAETAIKGDQFSTPLAWRNKRTGTQGTVTVGPESHRFELSKCFNYTRTQDGGGQYAGEICKKPIGPWMITQETMTSTVHTQNIVVKSDPVREAQELLAKIGFQVGPADGILGSGTRNAISTYQQVAGLPVDGEVSSSLLEKLRQQVAAMESQTAPAVTQVQAPIETKSTLATIDERGLNLKGRYDSLIDSVSDLILKGDGTKDVIIASLNPESLSESIAKYDAMSKSEQETARKTHYARNRLQDGKLPKTKNRAVAAGWVEVPRGFYFHRLKVNGGQSSDPSRNTKYILPTGTYDEQHYEAVYDGNGSLVTAAENMGTYNYCNFDEGCDHIERDIVPYLIWGNSEADNSTQKQREQAVQDYLKLSKPIYYNSTTVASSTTNDQQAATTSTTQPATIASTEQTTTGPANPVGVKAFAPLSGSSNIDFKSEDLQNLKGALSASVESIDCKGCRLGRTDLSNVELTLINFTNATLSCSNMTNAIFSRTYTPRGSVPRIVGGYFSGSNLSHALFSGSNLEGSDFRNANLIGARFNNANLTNSNFHSSILVGVDMRGANLSGVNFNAANLKGAKMQGADLSKASLVGAKVSVSDLNGAKLCETTMPNGTQDYSGCAGSSSARESTLLPDAQPIWFGMTTKRTGINTCKSTFAGEEVRGVDWGGPAWKAGLKVGDVVQHIERSLSVNISICDEQRKSQIAGCEENKSRPDRFEKCIAGIEPAAKQCVEIAHRRTTRLLKPGCDTVHFYQRELDDEESLVPLNDLYGMSDNRNTSGKEVLVSGEVVQISVLREGQPFSTEMKIGSPTMLQSATESCPALVAKLSSGRPAAAAPKSAGTYRGATFAVAEHHNIYIGKGLLVTKVEPGSAFAKTGLRVGDFLAFEEDVRYGQIDSVEKIKKMVQDQYVRVGNRWTPFNFSMYRNDKPFAIALDPEAWN